MTVYSDVRSALRHGCWYALKDYFPDEATAPIIYSHLNGAEPAESYVIIQIIDMPQIGQESVSTLTDTLNQLSIIANYEVRAQFSFCGSLAADYAQTFQQRVGNNPLVHQEFRRNKLGLMRKSSVRRAPQLRDTQWVEYFNLDVTFSYAVNTIQTVDPIEGVIMEDEITGEVVVSPEGLVVVQ